MDIILRDLIKLWGIPVNQEKIDLNLPIGFISICLSMILYVVFAIAKKK